MSSSSSTLCPLAFLQVSSHQIPAFKGLPNTSVQNKPLLIYHSAFRGNFEASDIERHLKNVAVISPAWRYTMYSETHFHSASHEVLAIASGKAKCCFGGEDNPGRVEPVLERGDVVIVPAGAAHRVLEDYGGFQMIGSYPIGEQWDMCYGRKGEEEKVKSITGLGWFERDPKYGDKGPTLNFDPRWQKSGFQMLCTAFSPVNDPVVLSASCLAQTAAICEAPCHKMPEISVLSSITNHIRAIKRHRSQMRSRNAKSEDVHCLVEVSFLSLWVGIDPFHKSKNAD
jgi:uncharacterized protein YjlB